MKIDLNRIYSYEEVKQIIEASPMFLKYMAGLRDGFRQAIIKKGQEPTEELMKGAEAHLPDPLQLVRVVYHYLIGDKLAVIRGYFVDGTQSDGTPKWESTLFFQVHAITQEPAYVAVGNLQVVTLSADAGEDGWPVLMMADAADSRRVAALLNSKAEHLKLVPASETRSSDQG